MLFRSDYELTDIGPIKYNAINFFQVFLLVFVACTCVACTCVASTCVPPAFNIFSGKLFILDNIYKKKSNLYYTRGSTPKRVINGGTHLRGLAAGQHSS